MSELLYLAEWAVKRALELGATEADAVVSSSMGRGVSSEGTRLKATSSLGQGALVRVAIGKRVASTTASSYGRDVLEELVARAVEMAQKAEEDPHWSGLPDPEPPKQEWVGYDEGVATVEVSWMAELAKGMMAEAQRDQRLKVSSVSVGGGAGRSALANSRGVAVEERGTSFGISISLKAGEGVGSSWMSSRSLISDFYSVLEEASRLALDSSRAQKLGETAKGLVLFKARTFALLLSTLVAPALNAMSVLEGYSPLAGKVGQRVLGSLTIVDDGTMPGGMGTSLYDGEGVPKRRTVLVEEGVLKSYLHNTYTARRMGVESTGNAARGAGAVGVSPNNLIVLGGQSSERDLEAEALVVADGYLLSVHTVNPVVGNFSVVISNPYAVRGGELVPVKPIAVSGNVYEIADLVKLARRVKNTYTGVYAPDALVGGLTVSG